MIRRWERVLDVRRASLLLSVPMGLLAAVFLRAASALPEAFESLMSRNPWLLKALRANGVYPDLVSAFVVAVILLSLAFFCGLVIGMIRRPRALRCVRACYILSYVVALFYIYTAHRVFATMAGVAVLTPGLQLVHSAQSEVASWFMQHLNAFSFEYIDSALGVDKVSLFYTEFCWTWPVWTAVLLIAFLHAMSWRRFVLNAYGCRYEEAPAPGDRLVEDMRTHGSDPRYRLRLYRSVILHLLIVVIIPWFLATFHFGCVKRYKVPFGMGTPNPVVALVMVKKMKQEKKKPRKHMILNPNSLISIRIPDMDDSDAAKSVDEDTQITYTHTSTAKGEAVGGTFTSKRGKGGRGFGAGGPGSGGWPDGVGRDPIRFIRLKYDCSHWDDGMDERSGADKNFLEYLHNASRLDTQRKGEAHPIALLRRYPKGFAPPFVFMTGQAGNWSVAESDKKALRDYLTDGGLLFADASSKEWGSAFRHFIRSVMPGYDLLLIADDDPIYLQPFEFPHGAPALWHHDGTAALGIKYKGRWCVFYHPGDMHDAWKTGHSGLRKELADESFDLGVNIVWYSFTEYLKATRKYRK